MLTSQTSSDILTKHFGRYAPSLWVFERKYEESRKKGAQAFGSVSRKENEENSNRETVGIAS